MRSITRLLRRLHCLGGQTKSQPLLWHRENLTEPLPQKLQNVACPAGQTSQSGVLAPGSHERGGTVASFLLEASAFSEGSLDAPARLGAQLCRQRALFPSPAEAQGLTASSLSVPLTRNSALRRSLPLSEEPLPGLLSQLLGPCLTHGAVVLKCGRVAACLKGLTSKAYTAAPREGGDSI